MSRKTLVQAFCQDCGWSSASPTALDKNRHNGYHHHRKTGHKVLVRVVSEWTYGQEH